MIGDIETLCKLAGIKYNLMKNDPVFLSELLWQVRI